MKLSLSNVSFPKLHNIMPSGYARTVETAGSQDWGYVEGSE